MCNKSAPGVREVNEMEILVSVFMIHSLNQFPGKNSFRMAVFLLFFFIFLRRLDLAKSERAIALSGIFKFLVDVWNLTNTT